MSGISVPAESRIRYLKRRQQELEDLSASEASPEALYEKAQKIGHQVKGNAVTFEFDILTNNAKALETAALNKDSRAILDLTRELLKQVESCLGTLT